MLFREIISVYSENHKKTIKTLCAWNEKLLDVKVGGTYYIAGHGWVNSLLFQFYFHKAAYKN
jgi:hypothetical protein